MPKFTIAADWSGARAGVFNEFKYSSNLTIDDDPEDDIADDNFVLENETYTGVRKGERWNQADREQDRLEREADAFLAEMESRQGKTPAAPSDWGHGGSSSRSRDPRKARERTAKRASFAEKLRRFTQRALIQDAKIIVGAMRRNVKTLARSRHPFANYVTQRRDSDWKKAFSYKSEGDRVIVGVNKTKKGSLNEIFEQGGDILWSFASLYRDRTKAERRAIFKNFIANSPTWKRHIKKVSKIGDLKLDMTSGPAQPYLKALKATMSPLRAKLADEERERFWYARNKKHVHYPFVSKTLFEMSGLLSVPPRKLLTHLKTKGQDNIFHKGLLDMTQKELEAFCRKQNQLNKRRRNVKRNSIPNLRPEQLAGILKRVSWRNR